MEEALLGERHERQELGFFGRLFFRVAVGDELRNFRHLRRPAPVRLPLVLDGEMHG